jgi:hypothetical protein
MPGMSDLDRVEYVWTDGPMKGHRQSAARDAAEKMLGQRTTFCVPRSLKRAVYRFDDAIVDRRLLLWFVELAQ